MLRSNKSTYFFNIVSPLLKKCVRVGWNGFAGRSFEKKLPESLFPTPFLFQIFESGSGNFSNSRIRVPFRHRLQIINWMEIYTCFYTHTK